ncbi:hypothetical protein EV363DRAFT_1450344 [Boletus edulis]|nr:hypothetical protein EV363DRAFT_1450344 [Boletus edulis]
MPSVSHFFQRRLKSEAPLILFGIDIQDTKCKFLSYQLSSSESRQIPRIKGNKQDLHCCYEEAERLLLRRHSPLRLRKLSAALDVAGATREKSLSTFLESTDDVMQRATQTLQQEADRHRTLAIERDKLLQEIRRLPGFERFLFPNDFPQLRASAHSGPVVMLNAAETRCDALILLADVDHPTRGAGSWETLLSTLFNGVLKLVLDALAFSTVGDLSRIFWCPTGPFVFLPDVRRLVGA